MARSTMIHYVTGVTSWVYHAWNGNSVSFAITDRDGGREEVVLFFSDNPQEAKDFYERNAFPTASLSEDKKRINDLEKALERIAYGNIRLIDIGGIAKDALGADPDYGSISF